MQRFVFVIGFAFLMMFALGCNQQAQEQEGKKDAPSARSQEDKAQAAIKRVYEADKQLAHDRDNLPPKSKPSQIAWAVGRYGDGLDKLSIADCPADFQVAYKQHTRAWRELQAAITELPDGFFSGAWTGFKNALLRAEKDGGTARLEGGLKAASVRVRETWEAVENTGARYGVPAP
jgi:hypothetical protein